MKILQTANLGRSQGGISGSIRYAVYDTLGSESIAETNTGIYEIGSNTGIYGVELNLSTQFSGSILWSVANKPIHAIEEIKIDQKMARYIHTGRWKIANDSRDPEWRGQPQMIFFEDDNVTEIARYNLFDEKGLASSQVIFERKKV